MWDIEEIQSSFKKKNEISLVNMYYSEGQRTKERKATPLLNPL